MQSSNHGVHEGLTGFSDVYRDFGARRCVILNPCSNLLGFTVVPHMLNPKSPSSILPRPCCSSWVFFTLPSSATPAPGRLVSFIQRYGGSRGQGSGSNSRALNPKLPVNPKP